MKTGNRNLLVIICFIVLTMGCSDQPKIISATPDMVIIKGPPEKFNDAYTLAQEECKKNTKNAMYFPDYTTDLREVAFNCVGPEPEPLAEAEATTEETTTATEEVAEEEETITEEVPSQ